MRIISSKTTVRPELVEGPFIVRQAHYERLLYKEINEIGQFLSRTRAI